jgi:hypothetical protein
MRISELHQRMAKMTNRFSLIRSMTHPGNISNHFDAMHNSLSGQASAPQDSPYIGSVLSKIRPSKRNIASYVWLIKCVGDPVFCAPNIATGGSLGSPYAPLFIGSADNHPAKPGFKPPDVFAANETAARMHGRRQLLDQLEQERHEKGNWLEVHQQGFELATSPGPRQAFDLEREDPKLRDRYGRNPLGQNLLLARRLVEAGVGFVTVNGWTGPSPNQVQNNGPPSSSWDMHGAEMGMGNAFGNGSYGMGYCLPVLDHALSSLITDLEERGLLESTLICCLGEFGRTPRINQNNNVPGRQHWPHCYSAILAGGGIRGGAVYGESDKIGAYVKDRPVKPQDFSATIYHALNVPFEAQVTRDGRSVPLSTGQPLLDLFG